MSDNILYFPSTDEGPEPFDPSPEVHYQLTSEKCDSVISFRIPYRWKRLGMQEAFNSKARFSEHCARIYLQHLMSHCLSGKQFKEAA